MILEPIWEVDFSVHSYGFRPNRSTYNAIAYLGNRLTGRSGEGYQWVIEGDISSYFDTIPHRKLMKAVKIGCPNRPLALDRFLDSPCQSRLSHAWWRSIFNEKGVIQGCQLRPLGIFTTR